MYVLVVLWLMGSVACQKGEKREADGDVQEGRVTRVKVASVRRSEVGHYLALTGTVEPVRRLEVVPQIPGMVHRIFVQEGDRVVPGHLLARLDTKATELQLNEAEAAVAVAEANVNSATKDWERIQALRDQQTISPQQFEKAQLAYEAGQAQLGQVQAALNLVRHRLEVSEMKAPFAGVITAKHLEEGDMINPGMPGAKGVVTLMDISKVKIRVHVPEVDMGKVAIGQPVETRVDAYPERTFVGTVTNMNWAADPVSRSFEVEVTLSNREMWLKSGMYARVRISTVRHVGVLVVPAKAVLSQGEEKVVFVVSGSKAQKRAIQVGIMGEDEVEVGQGVAEGESVIVEGNYGLADGATVEVTGL